MRASEMKREQEAAREWIINNGATMIVSALFLKIKFQIGLNPPKNSVFQL